jgi:iron complex outermembrane receptor protein
MRPIRVRPVVLLQSLALSAAAFAQAPQPAAPAPAPADDRESRSIEEIIVTAERREQNLQDVAQTITAFRAEDLEKANLEDAYDLQLKVPALVATGGLPAITLRGLGQDTDVLGPGIDPGFQLHINDIYVSQLAIALLAFNDLERVEVLPGPQGTLFGRNSTGGSMNLHTKRPEMESWELSGDFGWSRYENYRTRLVANVPLIDGKLAARLAYQREWPSNYYEISGQNGNRQELSNNALSGGHAVRGSLRWVPSDSVTTDLILAYSIDKDDGGTSRPLGQYPTYSPGQSTIFFGGVNMAGATSLSDDVRELRANRDQNQKYETFWGQSITEIQIPKHVVKLNANYQYWDYGVDADYDSSDVDGERLVLLDRHKTWTGEATIRSDYDASFDWLFGVNYQNDEAPRTIVPIWNYQAAAELSNFAVFDGFNFSALSPELAGRMCTGPCIFQPGDTDHPYILLRSDVDTETVGVFADGGVDITDQIRFQAGIRYSWTSREMQDTSHLDVLIEPYDLVTDGFCPSVLGVPTFFGFDLFPKENCFEIFVAPFVLQPQTNPFSPNTLDASNVAFLLPLKGNRDRNTLNATPVIKEKTWDSVTGRARLEWRPAEGHLFYFGYSRGERHGGFNFVPSQEAFDSETINAFEIGAKNALLDGRLLLNSTAFYYDFENRFIVETINNVVTTVNAPAADIYGIELQFIWVPTDALQFEGNIGWLHSEFSKDFFSQDNSSSTSNPTSFCPTKVYPNTPGSVFGGLPAVGDRHGTGPTCDGAPPQNLKGNVLPRAPEWSVSLGGQYAFEMAAGTLTPRLDFSYRGAVYYRQFENPLDRQDAYTRTDLRLRFDFADAPVWVEVFGQNLENRKKVKTQVSTYLNRPRNYWFATPLSYGVRVGWDFTGGSAAELWPF